MDAKYNRMRIIKSSQKAIDELIKVIKEEIIVDVDFDEPDVQKALEKSALSADKLKSAAQAKKLAITDAFEIIDMVTKEENKIKEAEEEEKDGGKKRAKKEEEGIISFAEKFAKSKK